MEGSLTLHTLGSLVANATFSRRGKDLESLTKDVMKGSYLVILHQARHIKYGTRLVDWLKKFMMLSLMKPKALKVTIKMRKMWVEIN